jgi:hypothetical protein
MSVLPETGYIKTLKRLSNRCQKVCGTVPAPKHSEHCENYKSSSKGRQADKYNVAICFNQTEKSWFFGPGDSLLSIVPASQATSKSANRKPGSKSNGMSKAKHAVYTM